MAHLLLEKYCNTVSYTSASGTDWSSNLIEDAAERSYWLDQTASSPHVQKMAEAGRHWVDQCVTEEKGWIPWRTEWTLYMNKLSACAGECDRDNLGESAGCHDDLVGGQLDALFFNKLDCTYHLVDWKFTGDRKLDRRSNEFNGHLATGKGPLADVPDNSYGHYLVQQSCYAYFLKKRYGIEISTSRLVHIPSDVESPVAREIELDLLSDETIEALFAYKN